MSVNVLLKCCSLNYELITSICAIIISVISLSVSIVFSILQMKHNRKCVRPISNMVCSNYVDKIAFRIENVGIGPLIIKKLIVKNKTAKSNDIISLMPYIGQPYVTYATGLEGNAIGIGEKKVLIEITPYTSEVASLVKNALADMTVSLEYEDIYGQKFYDECFLGRVYKRKS